jgi:hypothetical protein
MQLVCMPAAGWVAFTWQGHGLPRATMVAMAFGSLCHGLSLVTAGVSAFDLCIFGPEFILVSQVVRFVLGGCKTRPSLGSGVSAGSDPLCCVSAGSYFY